MLSPKSQLFTTQLIPLLISAFFPKPDASYVDKANQELVSNHALPTPIRPAVQAPLAAISLVPVHHDPVDAFDGHGAADHEVFPKPDASYVDKAPQELVSDRALPSPVLHVIKEAPYDDIPPSPVKPHTTVTHKFTNFVAIPRAAPMVNQNVTMPFEVAVPRAISAPAHYKVHSVHKIIETPHVSDYHAPIKCYPSLQPSPCHCVSKPPHTWLWPSHWRKSSCV